MNWKIGDPFHARDTRDIRNCGIVPGTAGRIEGINGAVISFYIEKSSPKQFFTQGQAALGTFGENFAPDKAKESARRCQTTSNCYASRFPNDWERPSGRPAAR